MKLQYQDETAFGRGQMRGMVKAGNGPKQSIFACDKRDEGVVSMKAVVAVNMAVGPTIMLHSGALFDFLDPWSSAFTIEDIAQGLSLICRYAGQCDRFYSVAEHSLHVCETAPEFAYAALMHDAAEAFIGDVTRPLKQLLPAYKEIERNIENAIFQRFAVPDPLPLVIKEADLRVLAAEQGQIMPEGTNAWAVAAGVIPAPIVVKSYEPRDAKRLFLNRFEDLRPRHTQ